MICIVNNCEILKKPKRRETVGLFSKKNKKTKDIALVNEIESNGFNQSSELPAVRETLPDTQKGKRMDKEMEKASIGFDELATLTGRKKGDLLDESLFLQIKKIMAKVGKVVLRYSITDGEFEKVILNLDTLGADGIILSPVYIPACAKVVKKHGLQSLPITAVVDFPFGESMFKSKIADVKSVDDQGVDAISVMMPVALTAQDKLKMLKKQLSKLASMRKGRVGIALNATDVSSDALSRALKLCEKVGVKRVTLVFGAASVSEVVGVVECVQGAVKNLRIDVLANVGNAEGVVEISKCKIGAVYTPFADEIGAELLKRFKIKSATLK